MTAPDSLYHTITNDIIAELEQGVAPWVKPWTTEGGGAPLLPYNAASKRRYQGVNVLLLWQAAREKGYRSPAWLGFQQASGFGGHVKKGEKSTLIVYGSTFVPKDEREKPEEEQHRVPFLKRWGVFNVEQVAGLPESVAPLPLPVSLPDALEQVEAFLQTIGADVRHGGDRACYVPSLDGIRLPPPEAFESAAHYYSTSLHEHTHWTGHESRLNRNLTGRFGEAAYAAEELVAELGAAFLSAALSIPGRLRHAEYIGSWLTLLQHDARAIFTAASKATEAARYLEEKGGRGVSTETDENEG